MCRIAEGIEDGRNVVGNCLMHVPSVLCGYGKILGKASVAIDADAIVFGQRWRLPARQALQTPHQMWPSADTRSPIL